MTWWRWCDSDDDDDNEDMNDDEWMRMNTWIQSTMLLLIESYEDKVSNENEDWSNYRSQNKAMLKKETFRI